LLEMRLIEPGRERLLLLTDRQIFEGRGHLKVLQGQSIHALTEQMVNAVLQKDREGVIPEVTDPKARHCLDLWGHQQVHEEGTRFEA
jgi:hypothetical protein